MKSPKNFIDYTGERFGRLLVINLFQDEVEKYKQKLRERRSLWDRLFPYKIIRKEKQHGTGL